jgi:hypothetical protein
MEKFEINKETDIEELSKSTLKKQGIFGLEKPTMALMEMPKDISATPAKDLGGMLVNYEQHAGWVRSCMASREIDQMKFKYLIKKEYNKLHKKLSETINKDAEIKLNAEINPEYIELQEMLIKVESDIIVLKSILDNITNLYKAISREITIRNNDGFNGRGTVPENR